MNKEDISSSLKHVSLDELDDNDSQHQKLINRLQLSLKELGLSKFSSSVAIQFIASKISSKAGYGFQFSNHCIQEIK